MLHTPLIVMKILGRVVPYVRELADMMALFDAVGFAADPPVLRDIFGVHANTIEEWARDREDTKVQSKQRGELCRG